ncbi:hypothetical protein IFM46972_06340 [Aspergillus udagawae]|uniref:Uncharacterized protein n=1 Tax=Aspergillus udagawae TaxID=91492 RepID=A0A8H3S2J7_9EURO|nr:hypothetical protein IFM46972_06340 [Aspergillus udagawae]
MAPRSPKEWKDYAQLSEVKKVPLREFQDLKSGASKLTRKKILTTRAVYLEYPQIVPDGIKYVRAFADVIALKAQTEIDLSKSKLTMLAARVLTADSSMNLEFIPADSQDCAVTIYASILDHPLSYSVKGTSYQGVLKWTPKPDDNKTYAGVKILFHSGSKEPKIEYLHKYNDALPQDQLLQSMKTQIRIASVLFWTKPAIAISLASYLASATSKLENQGVMNLQAVTLGQQLAAQAVVGPNMSYAPVLSTDVYKEVVSSLVATAKAFEEQYNRFQDKKEQMDKRLQAWDTMTGHAKDVEQMRQSFTKAALDKYTQATDVASCLKIQFEADEQALADANKALQDGLKKWKKQQQFRAAYKIIGAVLGFAVSIAMLCTGSSSPPRIDKIIDEVATAEKIAGEGKKVTSSTLKSLLKGAGVLYKLYPTISDAVDSLKLLQTDPGGAGKKITEVTGIDADSAAIVSLADWDNWILQSDEQLEFAVKQEIEGAKEYRLALQKHAINSKALIQARAEAIKAGQEYIHSSLEQTVSTQDLKRLDELRERWGKDELLYKEAEARFYDRLMTVRTSIVIQMRNLTWAYKYAALEDSGIGLSADKSTAEYSEDLSNILIHIANYKEKYPYGFQTLQPQAMGVKDLPTPYISALIESLKTTHSASFTFIPQTPNTPSDPSLPGPFSDGCHFRITGLLVSLVGAVPKPHSSGATQAKAQFRLAISTSGVYADVAKDGSTILQFSGAPLVNKRCEYSIKKGEPVFSVTPIEPWNDYSSPTPFTKWTITIRNADELDLDKLTDVQLKWTAKFYGAGKKPNSRDR